MTPSIPVALLPCHNYDRAQIKERLANLLQSLSFTPPRSSTVLLKPNLVSGRGHDGLACTHPEFVAAAAELFLDYGARVAVGDSPAFGSALEIMTACGYNEALASLPVRRIDFSAGPRLPLGQGLTVRIARQVMDCDVLVNLPRVKAHSQLRITLALKNLFGTVIGWRKPLLHMRLGDRNNNFARMLVDLAAHFPNALHLIDGIVAMHESGPVCGSPFALNLVGAATNPVAADTALLAAIHADAASSPLWQECNRRQLPGCRLQDISFPLHLPAQFRVQNFLLPKDLSPIRFHPFHAVRSLGRRMLNG